MLARLLPGFSQHTCCCLIHMTIIVICNPFNQLQELRKPCHFSMFWMNLPHNTSKADSLLICEVNYLAKDVCQGLQIQLAHPIGVRSENLSEALHLINIVAQLFHDLPLQFNIIFIPRIITPPHERQEFPEIELAVVIDVNMFDSKLNLSLGFLGLRGFREVLRNEQLQLFPLHGVALVFIIAIEGVSEMLHFGWAVAGVHSDLFHSQCAIMLEEEVKG
mmetsp:Transcript_6283/g.11228  ORF Transcript_6283/g.11228 Transcript_6283/m.11228 type:complete len:219 (+) Transcript_6283:67-723(+)